MTDFIVQSLGSGSSGNGLIVVSPDGVLLVDCGVTCRSVRAGLGALGLSLSDIRAVLLTHEHIDHVRSLKAFLQAGIPIVATAGTASVLGLSGPNHLLARGLTEIELAGVRVTAIPVRHDAAEPVGYSFERASTRVTVAIDLGIATTDLLPWFQEADLLVIEANHDMTMLDSGPYPTHLKHRVRSERGHLSNEAAAEFTASALAHGVNDAEVWLAHLSETNNRPLIAQRCVSTQLQIACCSAAVTALPRRSAGPTWRSDGSKRDRQLALF